MLGGFNLAWSSRAAWFKSLRYLCSRAFEIYGTRQTGRIQSMRSRGERRKLFINRLSSLNRKDLDIADVGRGTGWFCPYLTPFGRVTATDLSDEVLSRAQHRTPDVRFVSGDFMNLDFGTNSFDVVITLEVLAHVADQRAFLKKRSVRSPAGGHPMLATQNCWVLRYLNLIPPPAPGQLRRWVDQRELRELLEPNFEAWNFSR